MGIARTGAVMLLVWWAAPPAHAQEADDGELRSRALEHYERGIERYEAEDFDVAAAEFQRAYETAPNFRVLWNLGQARRRSGRHAEAYVAFERYLWEGGDEVPAARVRRVNRFLEELEDRVARLEIETEPSGARLFVDERYVGTSPQSNVIVSAGRHEVRARFEHGTEVEPVEVVARDRRTVTLRLPPPSRGSGASASTSGREGPATWPLVLTTITTVAAGAAWAVFAALAASADGDLQSELETYPADVEAVEDAQDQVAMLSLVADITGGVAIASAIVLGIVVASMLGSDEEEPREVEAAVGPGGAGLTVRW